MYKLIKSVIRLDLRTPISPVSIWYSTFRPAEFQFETSDGESGTLIHRFSRHIALTKRDFTDKTKFNFKFSSFYPVYRPDQFLEHLSNISTHDLGKLICMTTDFRGKADIRMYTDVVNALDDESENRVERAAFRELAGILHGFMYLLPNKITKLKTYQKTMPLFVDAFRRNVNRKDFMTVLFFLGLWKKNATGTRLMQDLLEDYLPEFMNEDMDLMDFVIMANASYKTSVRIKDQRFLDRLEDEICNFQNNDYALFVTLIKCARMNQIRSNRIVTKLKSILQDSPDMIDFRGLSHLFAYVADNMIKDDALINMFVEQAKNHIEAEILAQPEQRTFVLQNFRAKDLATFLWSCSTLSLPIEQLGLEANELKDLVFRKIDKGEYRYIPDTLVDTCLSLWILGYQSVDMLSSIYSDNQFAQKFKKDRVKIESRRDLLLACAEIERPEAFKIISKLTRIRAYQVDRSAPDYLIKNRKELQRVRSCLESIRDKLSIGDLEFNLPIRFLNIAGILMKFENGETINLDVLDTPYCLSDEHTPAGLISLKQRLLKKMGVETILINPLQTKSEEALIQNIENAIRSTVEPKLSREINNAI